MCACMHIRVHIRNYANFIIYIYIYIWACMYVCVYIYSKGNVLPSVLVPVYVLYIFRYHTLLYGRNKEIYLSYSRCFVLFWKDETDLDLSYCF